MQTVGIKIDKPYALQRFKFDINRTDSSYNKNAFLDFAAVNYAAEWDWSLTPHLTGVLSTTKRSNLAGFADFRATQQNIQENEYDVFRAEYAPSRTWAYIVGVSNASTTNSQVFLAQTDSAVIGYDYGIKYNFSSGSSVSLLGHTRSVDLSNRPLNAVLLLDNGSSEQEYEVNLYWSVDGKSRLSLNGNVHSQDYDHFSQRNYTVLQGDVSYDYQMSSKLALRTDLSRKAQRFETATSTYALRSALDVSAAYAYSDKLSFRLNGNVATRDFEQPIQAIAAIRSDSERSFTAGVTWQPQKFARLGLNTTKSARSSNFLGFDYDDLTTMLSLDIKL